jgi:uncharacterized protein (TIGR02453 family)
LSGKIFHITFTRIVFAKRLLLKRLEMPEKRLISMANGFEGFPVETLRFLRQLKRNNNREWFLAHKDIYELKVKAPMIELVLALGQALRQSAPEFVVDPKRAIYRIYRDIRFSADKRPYKTHVAAIFVPRGIPKKTGACLYFHVDPAEVVIAGGVYMPDASTLRALRQHIAANWKELMEITKQPKFRKMLGTLQGERLVRPPSGFRADHPAIDYLRQKQFYVTQTESARIAEGIELFPRLLALFSAMIPLVRYLNAPLESMSDGIPESMFRIERPRR